MSGSAVLVGAVVGAAARSGRELVLPQQVEEVPGQGIRGQLGGVAGQPGWVKAARRRARLDGALTVFVAAAAAGLLPAVWGALLQEAIDVAVILNALRALRPATPPRAWPPPTPR